MGCGISTMDRNDIASTGRRRVYGRLRHQNAIVPPVGDNNKKICDNVDDDYNDYQEPKRNEEGLIEKKCVVDKKDEERNIVIINERQKKLEEDKVSINHKNVMNYEEEEENNEDRIIGPGSPSFREYCNDSDLVDTSFCSDSVDRRISAVDSNDCDSGESTKNSSDDDSTKPRNDKSVNSNKETEKKERRGLGFRNVMNKGKGRGKKKMV